MDVPHRAIFGSGFSLLRYVSTVVLVGCGLAPVLAAQRFGPQELLPGGSFGQGMNGAASGDLDGDGDADLVVTPRGAPVVWLENTSGMGPSMTLHSVAQESVAPVRVVDVDGDGDLDLVGYGYLAGTLSYSLYWHENVTGVGAFGPPRVVDAHASTSGKIQVNDLDGDGDQDILFAATSYPSSLQWYENTNGQGSFGLPQVIASGFTIYGAHPADIDGDGDPDIVVMGSYTVLTHVTGWYENTNGLGAFGTFHNLPNNPGGFAPVVPVIGDLDSDSDPDLLFVFGPDMVWQENTDGLGTFGPLQALPNDPSGAGYECAHIADLDGDGDRDVLASYDWFDIVYKGRVAWWENTNGSGAFAPPQPFHDTLRTPVSFLVDDLDADGDPDILTDLRTTGGVTTLEWHANTDGAGSFSPGITVASTITDPSSLDATDIDGDGDQDLLVCMESLGEIVWLETPTNGTSFADLRLVRGGSGVWNAAQGADIDGDGRTDVLVMSEYYDGILWLRQIDDEGTFDDRFSAVAGNLDGINAMLAVDADGDGDLDVVAAALTANTLTWHENVDGTGGFVGPVRTLQNPAGEVRTIDAADLDGDGDEDLLAAASAGDWIGWFPVLDDGSGFGARRVIQAPAGGAWGVAAADLDGDGDLDVLSGSVTDSTVAWYENQNGLGTFGPRLVISNTAGQPKTVAAVDLDGDGDLDVVSSSDDPALLTWYENVDGTGTFGAPQNLATDLSAPFSILPLDIDGDGDQDLLSAQGDPDGRIVLFHNGPYAAATFRNAGANPASYSAVTLPELGGVYTGEVDLAGTTGHTLAMLAGFASPATFTLGGNTVLVDITHPAGELLGWPIDSGPVASFNLGIPPDPVYGGLEVSTQAIHVGGVFPYVLSNAQDLFAGY